MQVLEYPDLRSGCLESHRYSNELPSLSFYDINKEIENELKILETAFKTMKNYKKITWELLNKANLSKLKSINFFDHLSNNINKKKLENLYSKKIKKDTKVPESEDKFALYHDLEFSLVLSKELENQNKKNIVLEPKYLYFEEIENEQKARYVNSPDMIVGLNDITYSVEIKMSEKGTKGKAIKQIKNSLKYDNCDFGICTYFGKKIDKIKKIRNINKNIYSKCFIKTEDYKKLEDLGLKKRYETEDLTIINYNDVRKFVNDFN